MRITFRMTPFLMLAAVVSGAGAQTQTPGLPGAPPEAPQAEPVAQDPNEIRSEFLQVLRGQPSTLGNVLRLEPSLMQNEQFLASYPGLAEFLAAHPSVVRNPVYYVGEAPRGSGGPRPLEAVMIITLFLSVTGGVVWLTRTLIDYRRWSRLTRVQTDVHSKLLDRFTNLEDLQAYFESPGGRRFLESAPIQLDSGGAAPAAPANRILWSVQAGFVLALAGGGLYLSIPRITDVGVADALNVVGTVAIAVGIGFVLSAGAALLLSRKMGLVGGGSRGSAEERG
jgi:hypothetical protein